MAQVEVVMPKMGESVMEGTVLTWYKQPGDAVDLDETLLEIGTDKVDSEIPSPAAGVLKEILVPEGDTVEVNTVIAVIETDPDAAGTDAPQADAAPEAAPAEPEPAPEPEPQPEPATPEPEPVAAPVADSSSGGSSSSAGGGPAVEVVMPKMGESVMEGTVLTWYKQPGETIDLDETLLEIGTDKVDSEIPSPAAGVLQEILVPEGETVEVGTVLATIGSGAPAAAQPEAPAPQPTEQPAQAAEPKPAAPEPKAETPAPAPQPAAGLEGGDGIPRRGSDGQFFSPLVRSIAEKEGVSLQELEKMSGSGSEGRVTKKDLMAYIDERTAAPAPQPAAVPAPAPVPQPAARAPQPPARTPKPAVSSPDGRVEIVEMDRMRQIISDHMTQSLATSAHVTTFAEADVTNLVKLRQRNKEAFQKREGVKLTFTPFFVEATVEALREHPLVNSSVQGRQIHIKKDFHIGIAVALGQTGLVVPVIRNAGG
ncbi:MAG: biotin/lipoyl-containing protein, partial [Bacteroidota bacterium]